MITPDKGELVFVEGCKTAEQCPAAGPLNSCCDCRAHTGPVAIAEARPVSARGTCFNEQLLFGLPPLEGKLQPQGNCEVQIMPPGCPGASTSSDQVSLTPVNGRAALRTAEIFDRVVSAPRL